MHDDLRLAAQILAGQVRARQRFADRFAEETALALEHCTEARARGLDPASYGAAVARASARALLASVPAESEDAEIDPYVRRILGHRDFAVAVLLSRGDQSAYELFNARFGDYLRQLFRRGGADARRAEELLKEVAVHLLATTPTHEPPIAEYGGRCDLVHWIYARMRLNEAAAPATVMPPPEARASTRSMAVVRFQTGAVAVAGQDVGLAETALAENWDRIAAADRTALERLACGARAFDLVPGVDGRLDPLAAVTSSSDAAGGVVLRDLLHRHAAAVRSLWAKVVKVVAKRSAQRESIVDQNLRETLIGEIEGRLAGIFGDGAEDE